jgi:hypothetical protein
MKSCVRLATLLLTVAALCGASAPSSQGSALWKVGRGDFCVTNGVVSELPGGKLAVNSASSRGVVRTSAGATAEIRFRYLGSSADSKPLASGEMRRQIGLKLRAQDTCNLLYVMWHIEPDAKIGVSIKRNTGKHTHTECHADGYTTLKATTSIQPPHIVPGEYHTLRAELSHDELEVFADGQRVWVGTVSRNMIDFDGPVGFRTDNARFEFEYFATRVTRGVGLNIVDERLNRCALETGE